MSDIKIKLIDELRTRIIERSNNCGQAIVMRRFYANRKRIGGVFSMERFTYTDKIEGFPPRVHSHHVTLFAMGKELATFLYDRHENVYVNADNGEIYKRLRDGVYLVLYNNGYLGVTDSKRVY